MNFNLNDIYKARDSLMAWSLQQKEDGLRSPLIREFKGRLQTLDDLLADHDVDGCSNYYPDIPTTKEMMITFLLNRCEAIRGQVAKESNQQDHRRVHRILYPGLHVACLQNVIRLLMQLKKCFKFNNCEYTSTSIWQLLYLKYPAGWTKFFTRVMARIRIG